MCVKIIKRHHTQIDDENEKSINGYAYEVFYPRRPEPIRKDA